MFYTVIENGDSTYRIPYAKGDTPDDALRAALKVWIPEAADQIDNLPFEKDAESLLSKIDGGFDFGLSVVSGADNRPVLDAQKAGDKVFVSMKRILNDANYWAVVDYIYNPTKATIKVPGILMFRTVVMNDVLSSMATAIANGIKDKKLDSIDSVVFAIAGNLYAIGSTSPTFKEYMQLLNDVYAALPVFALGHGVSGLKFDGIRWTVAPYNLYTIRVSIERITQLELIELFKFINGIQKAKSFDDIYKLVGVDKYATKV